MCRVEKFDKDISVVLPAYNEEESLESCVNAYYPILEKMVRDFEIILVNDGSSDRTADICAGLARKFKKLNVITKAKNEGYGFAIRDGFKIAKFDLVFFTDADRQFDIGDLEDMLGYSDKFDLVIGYRKDRKDTLDRKIASLCYNLLIRSIFRLKVRDINCAFKIFHKNIFERISIESNQYVVNTEILVKALALGYSIKEVGVSHFLRYRGKSKVGASDIRKTLREVMSVKKSMAGMKRS